MKTFRYKIAHFTPDKILIWSKEHQIDAADLASAHIAIAKLMAEKGYIINIDFEIVYVKEAGNE